MNEWEKFCRGVIPLHKKQIISHIPKNNRKPVKRYHIDKSLDLHNKSVKEAYNAVETYIEKAKEQEVKKVNIITGKSGVIKNEFQNWAELNPNIRLSTMNKNEGSFSIKLAKANKKKK